MPPCINATISTIKNLQYNFPKKKGGSRAVWNFSKNSSDLVAGSFPYQVIVRTIIKRIVITIQSGVISNSEISAQGHFSAERTTRFSTISTIRQRAAFMLRSLSYSKLLFQVCCLILISYNIYIYILLRIVCFLLFAFQNVSCFECLG